MNFYWVDPLSDDRWNAFTGWHPRATAFHQKGWLQALARTYGYIPRVLTTAPPDAPLQQGIVLCFVSSWLTGTRLVSLPFSDHCDPLLDDNAAELTGFLEHLQMACKREQCRYFEIRPLLPLRKEVPDLLKSGTYCFHTLELESSIEKIFHQFHKDCIQRKIRRAERENLSYEVGKSKELVDEFYRLMLMTRKRHHLLLQPRAWFQNLTECLADGIQIRVARYQGRAIAAMLSLRSRTSIIYKYGCSDARFHRLGGIPLLFWMLIKEAKATGVAYIDLGRSDLAHSGLITFKERLGAQPRTLTYFRYTMKGETGAPSWGSAIVQRCLAGLPAPALYATSGLYRHFG